MLVNIRRFDVQTKCADFKIGNCLSPFDRSMQVEGYCSCCRTTPLIEPELPEYASVDERFDDFRLLYSTFCRRN